MSSSSSRAFESSCSSGEGDTAAVSYPHPDSSVTASAPTDAASSRYEGDDSSAGPSGSESFVHKVTLEELLAPEFNGIAKTPVHPPHSGTDNELDMTSVSTPVGQTLAPSPAPGASSTSPASPQLQQPKKRKGRAFSVLFQRFSQAKSGLLRRNRSPSQNAQQGQSSPLASSPPVAASATPSPAASASGRPGPTPSPPLQAFALPGTPGAPSQAALLKPSMTRIRTLPPKDPKEEAKHLKMRKQMEKLYLKKVKREAKEEAKSVKRQAKRDAAAQKNAKVWADTIIPQWPKSVDTKQCRNLVKLGIPSHLRCRVWPLAVGNQLAITDELFRIYSDRGDQVKERIRKGEPAPEDSRARANTMEQTEAETLEMINLDIPRTFPDLQFYQQPGPPQEALRAVLLAYVCYRPDIGYVQGMSYLAGMLILHIDQPEKAFSCFANTLNSHFFPGFLRMDVPTIVSHLRTFSYFLKDAAPKVYRRFVALELVPEMYMIDWLVTLFAKALPIDTASRIWDAYFIEGEVYIHRIAIAILKLHANVILGGTFEDIMLLLNDLHDIDEDLLFDTVDGYQLSPKKFNNVLQSHIREEAAKASGSNSTIDVVSTVSAPAVRASGTAPHHHKSATLSSDPRVSPDEDVAGRKSV